MDTNKKRILFIQFSSLETNHGISYKIQAQKDALCKAGFYVQQTKVIGDSINGWNIYVDNVCIKQQKPMNINIFKVFYSYPSIVKYAKENQTHLIYWRWGCFTIGTLILLIRLWWMKCRIIMEIPTYPYENEWDYSKQDFIANLPRRCDQIIRHFWKFFIYRIVTFSEDKTIYGVPCINISNGYIPERVKIHHNPIIVNSVHLIAVAMVQNWHGFDRIIEGLNLYHHNPHNIDVTLTIVGDGDIEPLKILVRKYKLEEKVFFTGAISGADLDEQFDKANIAIGSLGRHRSGLKTMKSLKNVEYAARGIPFVYSENNPDFDDKPYILKAPADETPLNIRKVIDFALNMDMEPMQIHNTALKYTWENQMKIVARYFIDTNSTVNNE